MGRRGRGNRGLGKGIEKVGGDVQASEAEGSTDLRQPVYKCVTKQVMRRLEKSYPRSDDDDDKVVECFECQETFTFRKFKLHNIQCHLNTAVTTEEKRDDNLIMDHKFFSRRLNEFKKLTNAITFSCPKPLCESSFKSTLGLAYHLNTCGRSQEELDAVLITCEICFAKLTQPQLQWHRRLHENKQSVDSAAYSISTDADAIKSLGKRKAAMRARFTVRKHVDGEDGQGDDGNNFASDTDLNYDKGKPSTVRPTKTPATSDFNDFSNYAINFLESIDTEGRAWDDPVRNGEDFLLQTEDNSFHAIESVEEVDSYLPLHKESVEFKYISDDSSSNYHQLKWFEGETISTNSLVSSSVHHTGGSVLSMNWHPSGKLLAVSVGRDCSEDIDLMKCQSRQSCIQIYSCSSHSLSLQVVIGVKWGYATHIQWSSFCPDIMDSYNPSASSCFEDIEIFCRIGYLAMACEDTTIRILAIRIEDLKLPQNYEYKPGYRIKVYTKTPELCLKIHDSMVDDDLGNAAKFDWHENNQFLAAGYTNGTVAVYDLKTTSNLLVEKVLDEQESVTVIYPFWTFSGHRLSVRGICFDPMNPRFFATAGQDRCIKVWDVHTRMERDYKKGGIAVDMCWIRGWIHQAASFECHISYQSAMNNYVRIFSVGSSVGRPTCGEIHNFTSLDFYHGLTVQGTDDGKVNVTYYDWFWRECDFDRNRKKKNLVILSTAEVDEASYTPISKSNFSVELRKLNKSVHSSKAYQKLGIDEDEGIYAINLESKFGPDIYDPLPTPGSIDLDDETVEEVHQVHDIKALVKNIKSSTETDKIDDADEKDLAILDSINAITEPKTKDGLLPVYDVNIHEETPKIILSFQKQRPNNTHPLEGLDLHKLEEYVRFQPFIRVNKVSWSPNGNFIAVGYRNGLITLIPGTFDTLFS